MAVSYYFGPSIPKQLDTLNLAFVNSAPLRVDECIGSFSSESYCPENTSGVLDIKILEDIPKGSRIKVNVNIPNTRNNSFNSTAFLQGISASENIEINNGEFSLKVLNSPITIKGIRVTPTNTWEPIISQGLVHRKYTLSPNDETWLSEIPGISVGDQLILIYTVPEVRYNNIVEFTNLQGKKYFTTKVIEMASVESEYDISYQGQMVGIYSININGVNLFNSNNPLDTNDQNSLTKVQSIDTEKKKIRLSTPLLPDDKVKITYASYLNEYFYSGNLSDFSYLDLNPEYGHYITDNQTYLNSSDALLQLVNIYALPTAAIKYTINKSTTDDSYAVIDLTYYRGINITHNRTHFISHLVSKERSEVLVNRDGQGIHSTFGEAVFGRNYYNEFYSNLGDTYSNRIPCMLPIGKFSLTTGGNLDLVTHADIRNRGGGIPDDFNYDSINDVTTGLDYLRSFFDLGIWEGKLIKEGGKIVIKIDPSILKNSDQDTSPDKFTSKEIVEIVESTILPGIDYEIVYESV